MNPLILIKQEKINLVGKWKQENMVEVCHILKVLPAKQLRIYNNHHSAMIKDINKIEFPNLVHLGLGGNEIYSIQSLHRIDLPSIKEIGLQQNHIFNIAQLSKAKWQSLIHFAINDNHVQQMNPLILQQNSITLLSLEWTVSSVVGEDLCWVAKLSTPQIHQLLVWSHLRISQPPVIETLKRKYLRMNVYSSQ